jgi:hypothetical protein
VTECLHFPFTRKVTADDGFWQLPVACENALLDAEQVVFSTTGSGLLGDKLAPSGDPADAGAAAKGPASIEMMMLAVRSRRVATGRPLWRDRWGIIGSPRACSGQGDPLALPAARSSGPRAA